VIHKTDHYSASVSHHCVTEGAGGSLLSHAWSARISGPGFFLDR
jgi:hypothetical protein